MNDFYEMIGALSNALQKPDSPPWEVSTIQNTYIRTLEKMTNNIEPSKFKDVSETGEYKSCTILIKKDSVQGTRQSVLA